MDFLALWEIKCDYYNLLCRRISSALSLLAEYVMHLFYACLIKISKWKASFVLDSRWPELRASQHASVAMCLTRAGSGSCTLLDRRRKKIIPTQIMECVCVCVCGENLNLGGMWRISQQLLRYAWIAILILNTVVLSLNNGY